MTVIYTAPLSVDSACGGMLRVHREGGRSGTGRGVPREVGTQMADIRVPDGQIRLQMADIRLQMAELGSRWPILTSDWPEWTSDGRY